ncbi:MULTISPECIES: hypothetical protein [unclassified Streptomyces]|uniref:hypothetical protein n=1 Tax=unclassified Streptomyces TaxID=2593676 RepID=UPI002E2A5ED7|nr:hypothetical protein [Streptomyces sp. NBC_00273]
MPARHPERITRADLALLLDAPVEALRGVRPAEHVWYVPVRNQPDGRTQSDADWAEVAAAMVHAAGIAEPGDEQACRWIAVRHATDHIHILATLARITRKGKPPAFGSEQGGLAGVTHGKSKGPSGRIFTGIPRDCE